MRPRIETDIYPTRYAAFDAPGSWVVFTPAADGTYRSCRPDGVRLSRETLGAGIKYPGEMAVLHLPADNPHWPAVSDGAYVEIGGSNVMGWSVECHHTAPTRPREQRNATLRAATLNHAIILAEQWIESLGC